MLRENRKIFYLKKGIAIETKSIFTVEEFSALLHQNVNSAVQRLYNGEKNTHLFYKPNIATVLRWARRQQTITQDYLKMKC